MHIKVPIVFGSFAMIAFGLWHFFVPALWNWYAYISADELVLAVRAINILFSLCLVLIGAVNLILTFTRQSRFVMGTMLALSCVVWAVRCILQGAAPQGTISPWLQYGMMGAFLLILAAFVMALVAVLVNKTK